VKALFLAFLISPLSALAQEFVPPAFRAPVVDQANIISDALEGELNDSLENIWKSGGSQIAILTIEDLAGVPIEMAAIKTVEQWKLGSEKNDNGVLIFISKKDRALRIEVGQGLEGRLTDLYSKRIIEDLMIPRFREGDIDQGLVDGIASILNYTDPDLNFEVGRSRRFETDDNRFSLSDGLKKYGWIGLIFLILTRTPLGGLLFFLFFLFLISTLTRGRHRRFWYHGGDWPGGFGGGGFGGGFGGGGFSGGGGGGFSGGGASGRW